MIPPIRLRKACSAIPALVYLAAGAAFIKNRHSVFDFPLDDAWIHRVYSRSLAWGQGSAYNPGHPEAGSTSPLWSILTAPVHWLAGLHPHLPTLGVKAVGILLGLLAVLLVQRIATRLLKSAGAGATAAALFAIDPKFLFSAFSGMETNLLVVLLAGAGLAWMANRPWLFLLLVGLAPTARPEALIFLPVAGFGIVAIFRSDCTVAAKGATLLLPLLPMLAWSAFCLHATGHWLPNTFYLKAHAAAPDWTALRVGLAAATEYGIVPPALWALGLAAFAQLCLKNGRTAGAPLLLGLILPLAYVAGVVLTRTVSLTGYYWTRWIDPGAHLLAAAASIGFAGWLVPPTGVRPRRRIACGALGLAFAAFLIPEFSASFAARRDRLASDSRAIARINVEMGQWIRDHAPADAVVGVIDAGAIRYFGERETVDLVGLNNAALAFGRTGLTAEVARCDWLAIFPMFLEFHPELAWVRQDYLPRHETSVLIEEYTVCNATWQARKIALERKPLLDDPAAGSPDSP